MPSPFPGMDPFVEEQKWMSFHARFVPALGDAIVPAVRPRYVVDVEQHVFVSRDEDERGMPIGADVSVADTGTGRLARRPRRPSIGGVGIAARPVVRTIPMLRRRRQAYLSIRNRDSLNVVTVIEVLSPWNKTVGDGRDEYLNKRQTVFASLANLVELDLLRGGTRLPAREPLPSGDYFAFVCRPARLPEVDVYPWSIRDRLPRIPIPLATGDLDVMVDLQAVFAGTYERGGYDYALNYGRALAPPLTDADSAWARKVLVSSKRKSTRKR